MLFEEMLSISKAVLPDGITVFYDDFKSVSFRGWSTGGAEVLPAG